MGGEFFVGRCNELGRLAGLLTEVAAGVGGVALAAGEQGIGKSALLRQGLAGAAGCRVCWGAADELRQRFPLWLMTECLGQEARLAVHGEPVASDGAAGEWAAGRMGPVLSGDPVLAAVERLLALVDRLRAASPVVLVAEDLQWADEASRNTVQTHVSHVLAKLGARSRAEIAGEVLRRPTAAAGMSGTRGVSG
jgi:hypothetical protein